MAVTVTLISLGCAKNRVDAETMLGLLEKAGYDIVSGPEDANVIIVNTCGFIQSAKEESIGEILSMAEYKRTGACKALIVTGCLSQRYGEQMAPDMPEVDAFLGVGHIDSIAESVARVMQGKRFVDNSGTFAFVEGARVITTTPRYAYLKIADGCDNRCAYCAIPGIRGGYVSRRIEDVLAEAASLARDGFNEIIPIAQDTTRYGMDIYGRSRLEDLLQGLSLIEGVKWIRPLYLYPDLVTDSLIDTMASLPKVCNYIDLPIQHINDRMLRAMNRRGDAALIKKVIASVRARGDFALRTTLICGFPGETRQEADELLQFIKDEPFDRLGAFAYSREEDTPAYSFDGQIRQAEKDRRVRAIMTAQKKISHALLERRVGSRCQVVIEGVAADGSYIGRSMLEAPDVDGCIYVSGDGIDIGRYIDVEVTGAGDYDLTGVAL